MKKTKKKINIIIKTFTAFAAAFVLFTSVFLYTPFCVYATNNKGNDEEKNISMAIDLPDNICMLENAYAYNKDVSVGMSVKADGYVIEKIHLSIYDKEGNKQNDTVLFEQEVKEKENPSDHETKPDEGSQTGGGGSQTGSEENHGGEGGQSGDDENKPDGGNPDSGAEENPGGEGGQDNTDEDNPGGEGGQPGTEEKSNEDSRNVTEGKQGDERGQGSADSSSGTETNPDTGESNQSNANCNVTGDIDSNVGEGNQAGADSNADVEANSDAAEDNLLDSESGTGGDNIKSDNSNNINNADNPINTETTDDSNHSNNSDNSYSSNNSDQSNNSNNSSNSNNTGEMDNSEKEVNVTGALENDNVSGGNETGGGSHHSQKPDYDTKYDFAFEDIFEISEEGEYTVKATVDYVEIKEYKVGIIWKKTKYKFVKHKECVEKKIIIDKSSPKIELKFDDSTEGFYYNHQRRADLSVDDSHLDINSISIEVDAAVNDVNEDGFYKKELCFNRDGYYSGLIKAKDLFGNESVYEIAGFCIDTCAPSIIVNLSDETKYTSKQRIAKIEILDEHPVGESKSEYVFKEGKDRLEITAYDAAGNSSHYESDYYIQDFSNPTVELTGLEDKTIFNEDLELNIKAKDSYLDYSKSKVYLESKINGEKIEYSFDKNGNVCIKDSEDLKDDYYTLTWEVSDKASNMINGESTFSVNRKGSSFTLGDNLKSILGEYSEKVTDINISEYNLSRIHPEEVRVIFTYNAQFMNISQYSDYYIEEAVNENGYNYNYVFNDALFEKEGVYTISIANVDEAGNNNDTRLSEDSDSIRFGVKREKILDLIKKEDDSIEDEELSSESLPEIDLKPYENENSEIAKDATEMETKKQTGINDNEYLRLKDNEDKQSLDSFEKEDVPAEFEKGMKKRKALYAVFVTAGAILIEGAIRFWATKKIIAK